MVALIRTTCLIGVKPTPPWMVESCTTQYPEKFNVWTDILNNVIIGHGGHLCWAKVWDLLRDDILPAIQVIANIYHSLIWKRDRVIFPSLVHYFYLDAWNLCDMLILILAHFQVLEKIPTRIFCSTFTSMVCSFRPSRSCAAGLLFWLNVQLLNCGCWQYCSSSVAA